MHSSRMRTVHCSGRLGRGRGCQPIGVSYLRGVVCLGERLPGGCLPRGMSASGGGVSAKGVVCLGVCLPGSVCQRGVFLGDVCQGEWVHTPCREQNHKQV